MKEPQLCFERLERIRRVFDRAGGPVSLRDLKRSFKIAEWEIKEAAAAGWLRVSVRKPEGSGRPSRIAEFRTPRNAKVPPRRKAMKKTISPRHWWFAFYSVFQCSKGGMKSFGIPGIVWAYTRVYRSNNRKAAYVSASRLLKREDVFALRQWFLAQLGGEIPKDLNPPNTVRDIWKGLSDLGCERAEYAPPRYKSFAPSDC